MIYKNFTRSEAERAEDGALHLQSEDGQDWYDVREKLSAEKLKIAYQADGVIRQQSYNAVELFPENLSVAEVSKKSIPNDFPERLDGNWIFDGKKITPRVIPRSEFIAQVEETRAQLMVEANQKIAPLQAAFDVGIATDEELAKLKVWKTYFVLLSRVDVSKAPDVDWPKKPEV
ncbi:phage tail fiber assembly protein [Hafnia paralvei ATCC 29927]|uniref:tail fiber assembly protein n=1 Tax=Hafnia paralvei TaxID=546367 RepID=UPI0007E3F7C5|nr:tail fiber assembly protein [Hafnia paralvei]MDU1193766.1 tail fiber assembly protein [Enterobacteriaceae bacterium]MBU2673949.1 tail fiber assembly protein [Hafnia paralvei]MDU1245871.1 tail fiber assembly protein [Enterobacteriaceae bacterium]NIH31574.1 tail fiber assembly protein [Hafnia paralvei]OAT42872.1 phage tail fiber assembly protein [Hafnia paralvei ATCC 29927]